VGLGGGSQGSRAQAAAGLGRREGLGRSAARRPWVGALGDPLHRRCRRRCRCRRGRVACLLLGPLPRRALQPQLPLRLC
jgi:hypothetical protein